MRGKLLPPRFVRFAVTLTCLRLHQSNHIFPSYFYHIYTCARLSLVGKSILYVISARWRSCQCSHSAFTLEIHPILTISDSRTWRTYITSLATTFTLLSRPALLLLCFALPYYLARSIWYYSYRRFGRSAWFDRVSEATSLF
jgi:hypothetical protein